VRLLRRRSERAFPEAVAGHVLVLNWRDEWHPEGGGSEVYVRQIAERLLSSGIGVTWMTARYPGSRADETVDGIRYLRRGGHITVYLWAALLLLTRRMGRFTAVLEVQNGMPFLATWFTRRRVVVLVHHVHREQWSVVGPLLARFGWFMESVAAVRANRDNRYIAVSQTTRRELISLGVDAASLDVAYNGLPPVPDFEARERASAPTLVVLSRLVPHKQIDHVLRMLPHLAQRHPDIALRIVGSGWWADTLTDLTAELGLGDRVTFLGHVSDGTKFEELSGAWLHLLPSLKEGWGLSIVEAARAGTPSVAYRSAGGVNESILDGVTGVLATDLDDFAEQVDALLADPALRRELGEKAQVRAEQLTWEASAERIRIALFEDDRQLYAAAGD
jgi:glycosyltransferase involved in cell wall biosynthesis